ncbi:probable E3 ubiquitin-protein ligase BAH1-like isoform X2 [Cucurbita moschata]|uniref:RING-type E3 ubiquitin transferase n=1 Tax=Cucurbita moschata TaxID=3662 RepID=A0A6J1FB28_CUCMO|nr:probable E3 ubiquitin-protein ligase BAH1-like isoform X2 [Cucurbita moschata]
MKFGETFMEYLHGDREWFLDKCSHVEYKRLKKVLKSCRTCRLNDSCTNECELCDQLFFSELMREALDIAGCFSTRVRHLLHLHVAGGIERYMARLVHCFKTDQTTMIQEGRMLIEYVTMNAIAIRKILKKYDKVHSSVNGKNFKLKMRAEHIELLQSPWLIELGAFCLNFKRSGHGDSPSEFSTHFSFDVDVDVDDTPKMTLMLPDSMKLEYDLTCPICLDTLFDPYALGCGHLFCKSCVCLAASAMICDGPKAASPESKCPVCRETGVYPKALHMMELDMLLKRRCKGYWKERLTEERARVLKQTKDFWDSQTRFVAAAAFVAILELVVATFLLKITSAAACLCKRSGWKSKNPRVQTRMWTLSSKKVLTLPLFLSFSLSLPDAEYLIWVLS